MILGGFELRAESWIYTTLVEGILYLLVNRGSQGGDVWRAGIPA